MNEKSFKKARENIRSISMTPGEKKVLLKRVLEATASPASMPVRSVWTTFSFTSFMSSHRFASAFAVLFVVALGGGSLVSASQSALPGDALYPLKVNVVEPMRVTLAPNFIARAHIQSQLVQTRFEEAGFLAAQGSLDASIEEEISIRVTKHVSDLNTQIETIKNVSAEKATEVSDTAQAGIRAYARLLGDISSERGEERIRLSEATRDAEIALQTSDIATSFIADQAPESASMMMMSAPEVSDPTESTSNSRLAPTGLIELQLPEQTEIADERRAKAPEATSLMSVQNDLSLEQSTTTDRETRRQIEEEEIFQKAKEKLELRRGESKYIENIQ